MDTKGSGSEIDGWQAPVFHAMHRVPTFAGVPMGFFVADVLIALFVAMFWWPVLLVAALAYSVAWLGTQVEPRWLNFLWEYFTYSGRYDA
jgi:type IV secretory pathway VirB3-like protein